MSLTIYTILLVICLLVFLVSSMGQGLPIPMRFTPLIPLGLIWANTLWLKENQSLKIVSIVVMICFYFFTYVFVLPATIAALIVPILDMEQIREPLEFGNSSYKKKIAIVYHPGKSSFPTSIITKIGEELGKNNIYIKVFTAHKKLSLNFGNYNVVGLCSPVYAGQIRPPLTRFIKKNNKDLKKYFLILMGSDPDNAEADFQRVKESIKSGTGIAEKKFIVNKKNSNQENKINDLVQEIIKAL